MHTLVTLHESQEEAMLYAKERYRGEKTKSCQLIITAFSDQSLYTNDAYIFNNTPYYQYGPVEGISNPHQRKLLTQT